MATLSTSRSRVASPLGATRLFLFAGVPLVAVVTVYGTWAHKEILVAAGWLALSVVGFLFVRPVVGVAVMTAAFLLAAYPTVLQALGFLTINNLLGICLAVLLGLHVLETRDLSFLRIPQIRILALIGILLLIGTFVAEWQFPFLVQSVGKMRTLDRSATLGHNFVARLVFLVFFCVFVRTRSDIKVVFLVFMLALFAAVPSALHNLLSGNLNRGFRAAASVTAGANPNRLAMICLMQVACWWFWVHARPARWRQVVAVAAIGAAMVVCLATGSRSGLLGIGLLGLLLQTGPRAYRVPVPHLALIGVLGAIAVATVVPAESWERMTNFSPEKGEIGATSNRMREETIERAWQMTIDYPLFGIGLGNFREVARQVYQDPFYRPPHNSYLWASSEGGVFVLLAYLWLFWVSWRDLETIRVLTVGRDRELLAFANAIRVVFLLYFFFSMFADIWLNPITYCLLGLVITMRRFVEELARPETARPAPLSARKAIAQAAA